VEALDLKEARERLASQGILPETVAEAGEPRGFGLRAQGLNAGARADAYRELGALLRAGIPMVSALQIVINASDAVQARPLARVRDLLREGGGLSDALASVSRQLPAFERAALAAGERAGTLDRTMEWLADHMDEQERARERMLSALIYPAFVVGLAVVIAVGILGFALPNLGRLFADNKMPLPLLTRALLVVGRNAATVLLPAGIAVAAAIFLYVRDLRRNAARRESFERSLFRWPLVGKNLVLLLNARFARTFALLLKGGVGVVEGMELAGAATGNVWLANLLRSEAEQVRHGKTLTNAIKSVPPFSRNLAGWMEAGEASGSLAELLDRAGTRFHQQWSRHLVRCTNVLEPLLIVIVGAFVLMIALAVLLPILSLNRMLM
jgi:general secretion pathway protein F